MICNRRGFRAGVVAAGILFMIGGTLQAADKSVRQFGESATKSQMLDYLLNSPAPTAAPAAVDSDLLKGLPARVDPNSVATRGGILKPERATPSVTAQSPCPVTDKAFGTTVNFAVGSYYLEPSTFSVLGEVADLMTDEKLKDCAFVVEGHTDSTGNPDKNKVLSKQRAETVVKYLESHGVADSRMELEGKGSTEPADPVNPAADINRRVQFRFVDRQG